MPNSLLGSVLPDSTRPRYQELVRFLIEPLLDNPSTIKVDCEQANQNRRVWIRVAFDDLDKGRVYGRGGRNLQAIRTVIEAAARMAGQSVYLDIYNAQDMEDNSMSAGSSGSYRSKFVKKTTDKRRYRPRGSSSYYRYTNEETSL